MSPAAPAPPPQDEGSFPARGTQPLSTKVSLSPPVGQPLPSHFMEGGICVQQCHVGVLVGTFHALPMGCARQQAPSQPPAPTFCQIETTKERKKKITVPSANSVFSYIIFLSLVQLDHSPKHKSIT